MVKTAHRISNLKLKVTKKFNDTLRWIEDIEEKRLYKEIERKEDEKRRRDSKILA